MACDGSSWPAQHTVSQAASWNGGEMRADRGRNVGETKRPLSARLVHKCRLAMQTLTALGRSVLRGCGVARAQRGTTNARESAMPLRGESVVRGDRPAGPADITNSTLQAGARGCRT
jgi:hypothetical protein